MYIYIYVYVRNVFKYINIYIYILMSCRNYLIVAVASVARIPHPPLHSLCLTLSLTLSISHSPTSC